MPRTLVEIAQDVTYVINKLEQSVKTMEPHVKTGRPKVDPMRSWFISELAKLYETTFKQFPSLTQSNSFDHLVGHFLKIVGDPVEDSFTVIKKALSKKRNSNGL
jgi:hypothetical protein